MRRARLIGPLFVLGVFACSTTPSAPAPAPDGGPCGHDCQGGACVDGACQPVKLASDPGPLGTIAVDSKFVYWTRASANGVMRVPVQGGTPEELASTQVPPRDIAVDGAFVYWTEGTGLVWKAPTAGGVATNLAYGGGSAIAVDATTVYWCNGNDLMMVPKGGGAFAKLTTAMGCSDVAVDASSVYWAGTDGVTRLPIGGGAPVVIDTRQLGSITLDPTSVYGVFVDAQTTGVVVKVPSAGGTAITLASQQSNPLGLGVDSRNVFWTAYGGNAPGAVMTVPVAGGTPTKLVSAQSPGPLALDVKSVYWLANDAVMKLAKP